MVGKLLRVLTHGKQWNRGMRMPAPTSIAFKRARVPCFLRPQTENNIIQQIPLSLRTSQDAFYKKLRASDDGFAVITEYLGKGVLNCTSVSGAEF